RRVLFRSPWVGRSASCVPLVHRSRVSPRKSVGGAQGVSAGKQGVPEVDVYANIWGCWHTALLVRTGQMGRNNPRSGAVRRSSALTYDQRGRNDGGPSLPGLVPQPPQHACDQLAADLVEILLNGGQRRQERGRFRDVVEADHAHVLRYSPPPFVQGTEQTECHLVVGRKDRAALRIGGQAQADAVPAVGRPVPENRLGHRKPPLLEGLSPGTGPTLGGKGLRGTGQVPHGPVPQVHKVLDGGPGPTQLVGVHRAVLVARTGVGDDDLQPRGDQKTCCIEQVDLHDGDDRIHRQLAQPVEGSAHLVLRGKSYGQQRDGISLVRRGRGDRLQGAYVARGREG